MSVELSSDAALRQSDPMNLCEVRRWACSQGIPASELRSAYRLSFRLCTARLVQALYRERLCATQFVERPPLGTCLRLGNPPALLIPVIHKCFARIDVAGGLDCHDCAAAPIRSSGAFLRRLKTMLLGTPLEPYLTNITADFINSLSSVTINRLLALRADVLQHALEPAWQGHHYYPFPGLRVGPSVDQVVACSHLSAGVVELPLVEAARLSFRSAVFSDIEACLAASVALPLPSAAIPVHPWQLAISPVVAALLEAGGIRVLDQTLPCRPLASQRTMRACATGYDFKLAVDASITSEHRLIFRLNCENAPAISALVRRLVDGSDVRSCFDIQQDVASLSFDDAGVAPHLATIVRAPARVDRGEQLIPAINLWTGPELALRLLSGADADEVKRFFQRYCLVMLQGPLAFLLRYGLAFEPHLQNSVLALRGSRPERLILRDLDGTLMDRSRIEPLLTAAGLSIAADTWDHMPPAHIGEHRLLHALFFGHLVEAVDLLAKRCGIGEEELLRVLADVWWQLPRVLGVKAAQLEALGTHFDRGKQMLMARMEKTTRMTFVALPATPKSAREFKLFKSARHGSRRARPTRGAGAVSSA